MTSSCTTTPRSRRRRFPRCSSCAKCCAGLAKIRGLRKSWLDLDGIIGACLGLHLEAVTEKPVAQPGEALTIQIEAINRSPLSVKFKSLRD